MPDTVLALYFLMLCALAAAWILIYRAIVARLRALHGAKHTAIFTSQGRRKNGMDQFFSVVGFVFQSQSELRDTPLLLLCVALKLLAPAFLLVFIAMMFTPFFLQLEH